MITFSQASSESLEVGLVLFLNYKGTPVFLSCALRCLLGAEYLALIDKINISYPQTDAYNSNTLRYLNSASLASQM